MKNTTIAKYGGLLTLLILHLNSNAQFSIGKDLPVKYQELVATDYSDAVKKSGGVCVIPFGIMEKHGPHLPIGSDLLEIREISMKAAQKEYFVIFPEYYFGQINEARHQPGAIAYSHDLIWKLLQETCNELSRNGFKKIIIANGHGGNNDFLHYFCMSQLESKKDYILVLYEPKPDSAFDSKIQKLEAMKYAGHAGADETSMILAINPSLVKMDRTTDESGENQQKFSHLQNMYTGMWWCAQYPYQYSGDGKYGTVELGKMLIEHDAEQLANLVKSIKEDESIKELQDQFFKSAEEPIKTRQ
jgi:creatinine amidohydrolase